MKTWKIVYYVFERNKEHNDYMSIDGAFVLSYSYSIRTCIFLSFFFFGFLR